MFGAGYVSVWVAIASLYERKYRKLPEEIVQTLTSVLMALEEESAWRSVSRGLIVEDLEHVARMLNRYLTRGLPPLKHPSAARADAEQRREMAASVRELEVQVAHSSSAVRSDVRTSVAERLRAAADGAWDKFPRKTADTASTVPLISRIVALLRGLAAALLPLALVVIVPQVPRARDPNLVIDGGLLGTFFSFAIAWLGLWDLTWLDPRSRDLLGKTSNLPKVPWPGSPSAPDR